jgi:hypothetical protein
MRITHRKYESQRLSQEQCLVIGYNVEDDDGARFYCIITEYGLDPIGSRPIAHKDAMLDLFDAKEAEILEATKPVVANAKVKGVKHVAGTSITPLRVSL